METDGRLRVAMTVEQCWQPVPGGSGTYIRSLSGALARRPELQVVGVAARHPAPPPQDWAPPVPVAQHRLPRVLLYEAWQRFERPAVQRATGPVDVIHATTWAVPPRSAPLVVTVHDLAFLHDPGHFTRRGNAYFRRALERTRRLADLVITPSRHTAEDCVDIGIPAARLRVIPHGTETVPTPPEDVAEFRRARGLERPYVLWAGTREPRKNLPRLLAAFHRVRASVDFDLVLVGPLGWGTDLEPELMDDGRIHLLGPLDARELHLAYAGARALCYPSLREGFGLPVLEAISHGIPVVTSEQSPMADIAGAAGVCVDPQDTAAIAEAMRYVAGEAHDRLADAALVRSKDFSWERAAARTAAAYADARTSS